jgi:hypothetical protein
MSLALCCFALCLGRTTRLWNRLCEPRVIVLGQNHSALAVGVNLGLQIPTNPAIHMALQQAFRLRIHRPI